MKVDTFTYEYLNKQYNVFLFYKNQRNINYRLKDDGFYISAPYLVSKRKILSGLDKFAPKLIKHFESQNSNYSFKEDYVFLLGKKVSLKSLNIYSEDSLNLFLKNNALEFISNLVRKYESIMGVKNPYKIHVRNTSTRFGSNSLKTHSLSFQISLIHYSEEIITSVVVHELAHEFYRNHQKQFYNCVEKYCPNYRILTRKLKRGIHE